MKVIYKCAAILTAAILSVQFPCAAFADMEHVGDNDSPKFKIGRIIFTDNGYGYEKEGLEKSEIADEDLVDTDDWVSPYAQKATASLPAKYDPRSKNTLTTIKNQFQTGTCWAFAALSCTESNLIQKGLDPQGQFVGIIGHTGSGKSTLIQHLNGLMKATSGKLLYEGQNIYEDGYDGLFEHEYLFFFIDVR